MAKCRKPMRMLRMSVIVPWRTNGKYFMDVLRSHNPDLKTRYWEIKHVQERSDSTKFQLKVDEESAEILRSRNFRAYWLVHQIEFKMERGGGKPNATVPRKPAQESANGSASALSKSSEESPAAPTETLGEASSNRTGISQPLQVGSAISHPGTVLLEN